MKITKSDLKKIILEELAPETGQEAQPQQTARAKKVATAATTGARMDVGEYVDMLKQVLLSPQVPAAVRKAGLEEVFGTKGASINSLVAQMMQGEQG